MGAPGVSMPAGSPQRFPDLVKSRIATPEYHHGVERHRT
jgi:hypothetical protein